MLAREQEAAIELRAVGRDQIDLAGPIRALPKALARTTRRVATDNDNVIVETSELALNAVELRPGLEEEVVAFAVGQRLEDTDTERRSPLRDCELGDCPSGRW